MRASERVAGEQTNPGRTVILADDLTGACDAAAPFASRGARTLVCLQGLPATGAADVVALCTGTRDVPPEHSAETLARLAGQVAAQNYGVVFKKIDSTFRGNTFHEIVAAVQAFPEHLALIAPAFPALGRTCVDGALEVEDITGRTVTDLREPIRAAGLEPRWLSAAHAGELASNASPAFFNAATDADLRAIVQAARSLGRPVLWIGSAGLAHALAVELYPGPPSSPTPLPAPLLCVNGSNHPVTASQLARIEGTLPVLHVERSITTDDEIRSRTAEHRFRTLLLVGGDTALQVCRALGIDRIALTGEYAPGIAQGTACGGAYAGATMVLKSGGFGAEDLLLRIVQDCGKDPS